MRPPWKAAYSLQFSIATILRCSRDESHCLPSVYNSLVSSLPFRDLFPRSFPDQFPLSRRAFPPAVPFTCCCHADSFLLISGSLIVSPPVSQSVVLSCGLPYCCTVAAEHLPLVTALFRREHDAYVLLYNRAGMVAQKSFLQQLMMLKLAVSDYRGRSLCHFFVAGRLGNPRALCRYSKEL